MTTRVLATLTCLVLLSHLGSGSQASAPAPLGHDGALAPGTAFAQPFPDTDAPVALPLPPRVRDGLLEEPERSTVSLLVRLRGAPTSSVLLEFRERFGPQGAWGPAVREEAARALSSRDADLGGQRERVLEDLRAAGIQVEPYRDYRFLVNGINLRDVPAGAVRVLVASSEVLHIERDRQVFALLAQSVPLIDADDVWNLTDGMGRNVTGEGSVIANIDTGVDYTHPSLGGTQNRTADLASFLNGTHPKFIGGWDFVNNDADPWDDHFHGTHVAGIIGANGSVKGVAPGSKQLALKVLAWNGYGSDSDIVAAMEFAADPDGNPLSDDGADATSMSLGGWDPYPDGLSPLAADTSTRLGTLCVIAAGNSGPGLSTVGSPGVSRESITVGSSTKADTMSSFSSRGPTLYLDLKPDLVAPGSSIVSTLYGGGGGTTTASGTSMATPHVSGAVALLRQAHPSWSVDALKSALVNSARDLGRGVYEQGGGRLDALAAVNTSVEALPHKLAMGRLARAANSTDALLTFENLGAATVALNLTARDVFGMRPDMALVNNNTDLNFVSVSPSTLTLSPGERATVTVSFAPPGAAQAGHYWGSVNATFNGSRVAVPFAYYVRAPLALIDDDSSDRWAGEPPFDNFAAFPSAANNLSWSLERLGVAHDIITVAHYDDNGPDLLTLLNYPVVVWATGYDYDYSDASHTHHTLSARDIQVLSGYLDAGGQLWLVGESVAWDLYGGVNTTVPASDFLNAYLGAARVDHELNTPDPVVGAAGTFMAGASYATSPDWTAWGNNGDYATNLTPRAGASTVLGGATTGVEGASFPNASLAIAVNGSSYRAVFWGFEFSWLGANANFDDAVSRTLGFFNRTKALSLPANDIAVDVAVDPYKGDWLPVFEQAWGRPFDDLARALQPLNATVFLRNLGSAAQPNVAVNVTLRDNTSAPQQTVRLTFPAVPALSVQSMRVQLTPQKHGYFTVEATVAPQDANASNNVDASSLLVPLWQDEASSLAAWNATGDWRGSTAWSYTAAGSFRVGPASSANDSLTSPFLDLSRVNTSSIAGGARLYFRMSGSVSGNDTVYFETRNSTNATWVTQRTLTSFSNTGAWSYFQTGVALGNLANETGYFRIRFVTGASSSSTFYADHFMAWSYHERGAPLSPNATRPGGAAMEGETLDFRGGHQNPNNSTGVTYLWDFGDGNTSTARNTSHAFADEGNYTVRFTVDDHAGLVESAYLVVNVANVAPTVEAMSVGGSLFEGQEAVFNGSCADAGVFDVLGYVWDFGDGSPAAAEPATRHVFLDDGDYNVTFQCSDGDGGIVTALAMVSVGNLAPAVSLTGANATTEGSAEPYGADVVDPGVFDSFTFEWDFGDGTNSTAPSPSHTWLDDGSYSVTLRVRDSGGALAQATMTVLVRNAPPAAVVSYFGEFTEGSPLGFFANVTDPGAVDTFTYEWDFGDGNLSALPSPAHTFADDGAFTVTLTVRDDDGGVGVASVVITVANLGPVVDLASDTLSPVEGGQVRFTVTASDPGILDALRLTLDFGDGTAGYTSAGGPVFVVAHAFPDDGAFLVTASVDDGDGGSRNATLLVVVANLAPTVALQASADRVGENTTVTFSAAPSDPGAADVLTLTWDFGSPDFSGAPLGTNASGRYPQEGTYTVTVTVTDDAGASSQASLTLTVDNLAPDLEVLTPQEVFEGASATFEATAYDAGPFDTVTVTWQWGDGGTSSGGSASHTYAQPGNYTLVVTAADDAGLASSATVLVAVRNVAPLSADISWSGALVEGAPVRFQANVSSGPGDALAFLWEFGDGGESTLGSPEHAFRDDGAYLVRLTVADEDGGALSTSALVRVANAPPTLACTACPETAVQGAGLSIQFAATDAGVAEDFVYSLAVPGGTATSVANGSFWVVFETAGNITVVATVSDGDGGTATLEVQVRVLPDFDRDGVEDALDTDDDNDRVPDSADPDPLDPGVSRLPSTAAPGSGAWLLLLAGLLGGGGVFWALRRRRRDRG